MHGPEPVGWPLAALCAAVGAYCLLRMRDGGPGQRRTAAGEALMGFGMAVMVLPAPAPLPPAALAVFFGTVAGRELLLVRHAPAHHLHHAAGALAMVHMVLPLASAPAGQHGGHGPHPAWAPVAGWVLLAYFAGYVLRTGARLLPGHGPGGGGPYGGAAGTRGTGAALLRLPEVAAACRVAMGIGMFIMLLAP
ncbi:DUF5134 domain-containing protein [Streptomyces sp. TRM 70361]|uniref:DUF5134 domain-containing protein n=1 Tax=Streptomyces sp. TRM 70361 TaxID=3116553 RepID=UPI002E7C4CC1|nr:DUF5134 domain-containing protein [Streptomyces sp. TRM 70361]MEE1940756.1 DUF5134 domain-containing protein [Streptomyces sp. TRM 70361]